MDKKWIVSYVLNSDYESISIIELIAMKEFNEVAEYTDEEVPRVVEFLKQQKVPKFEKKYSIGSYEYETMEEWNEFVKENKEKIKKMLNG